MQNRLRESGDLVWRLLEGGAHFYVCGDAANMAGKRRQNSLSELLLYSTSPPATLSSTFILPLPKPYPTTPAVLPSLQAKWRRRCWASSAAWATGSLQRRSNTWTAWRRQGATSGMSGSEPMPGMMLSV